MAKKSAAKKPAAKKSTALVVHRTVELPEGPTRVGITLKPTERKALEDRAASMGVLGTSLARTLVLRGLNLAVKD